MSVVAITEDTKQLLSIATASISEADKLSLPELADNIKAGILSSSCQLPQVTMGGQGGKWSSLLTQTGWQGQRSRLLTQ